MASPAVQAFLELVRKSEVVEDQRLNAYLEKLRAAGELPDDPGKLAGLMVRDGLVTKFQAEQLLAGRWKGFYVGKYRVLERVGSGGMGMVFLAEHIHMRRRVAVKVLPKSKASDPSSVERFYREAKAVAAVDHPNLVRAYDIDQDGNVHFLVMEYIDGANLQEIVRIVGPLDFNQAANYIRQAARGLQQAHLAGVVHRDIKPGNILVDRKGVVKVLDMGLARFFTDASDTLSHKYDENVLGTADYLAPEQALDSHNVDIRADIYSLGCTFYYLLTGRPPFGDGTIAQKLIWHQTRQPKPLKELRPDIPDELLAIVQKMMDKDAEQRYRTPEEVEDALEPWTRTPVALLPDTVMPRLSPAARKADSDKTIPGADPSSSSAQTVLRAPRAAPTPAPSLSPATVAQAAVMQPRGPGIDSPKPSRVPAAAIPDSPREQSPADPRANKPSSTARPSPYSEATGGNDPSAQSEAPVITADESSEGIPWLSNQDTLDPSAALQDTFKSGPRSGRRRGRPALELVKSVSRRHLILGGGIAGSVFVVLAIILFFVSRKGDDQASPIPIGPDPTVTAKPPKGETWYVAKTGADFRTLADAIRKANSGDRIVVRDKGVYEEQLWLTNSDRDKKHLTIEAEQQAVLRAPKGPSSSGQALVHLDRVEGLTLKGFTLDGGQQVEELVSINGPCPGLVLEGLRLRGFNQIGVRLTSCQGTKDHNVYLRNLRIDPQRASNQPAQSALVFRPDPEGRANQFVVVQGCRFEGAYEAVVRLRANMWNCAFERNVFFGGQKDALVYSADSMQGYALKLQVINNTFCNYQRALFFQPMPDFRSNIEVRNNLFYQISKNVGEVEGSSPEQMADMLTGDGNIYDSKSRPGNLPLQLQSQRFTLPTDSKNPATFLRYPKDSPLAEAGKNKNGTPAPVGALPGIE